MDRSKVERLKASVPERVQFFSAYLADQVQKAFVEYITLSRTSPFTALYLWYKSSEKNGFRGGELRVAAEKPGDDFELAWNEWINPTLNYVQVRNFIAEKARHLPILPVPEVLTGEMAPPVNS